MAEIFQNMIEDMNPDSLEAQQTPGRINAKRSTPRHVIIKLLEVNDRENLKGSQREATSHIQEIFNKSHRKFLTRNDESQKGVA